MLLILLLVLIALCIRKSTVEKICKQTLKRIINFTCVSVAKHKYEQTIKTSNLRDMLHSERISNGIAFNPRYCETG
jgi:hypothetical protein